MDDVTRDAQNAMLRLLEESPVAQFILTVSEPTRVLPTVASRCIRKHFTLPAYGARLKDLTEAGMSMSAAAHTAAKMDRGYSVEETPDASAYNMARSLLEAARLADVGMARRLAQAFDEKAVSALRELLMEDMDYETVGATYEAVSPIGVASIAFHRRVQWGNRT